MSKPDEPKKKPPQPTVAWNPKDLPSGEGSAAPDEPTLPITREELAVMEEGHGDHGNKASDEEDPLVGTLLRGKWRVLGVLGAGSFGTVYKVKDEAGGWIEALKILAVDRISG